MIPSQYDQYDHASARARRATVRHVFALLVVIAAIWAIVLLAGCATKPVDKVTQARAVYTATLNALSDARVAGYVDDATALQIERSRRAAAVALDAAEKAALADEPGWRIWLDAAVKAVDEFARWRAKIRSKP